MDDLSIRITRLEREARAWRVAALVAILALGASLAPQVTAQGEGTTIKAPFVVTNEAGKKLLTVGETASATQVRVYHAKTAGSALIMATERGTHGFHCVNPDNELAASMSAEEDGGDVTLSSEDSQIAALMHVSNQGGMMDLLRTGEGNLTERSQVSLLATRRFGGSVSIKDEDGDAVFEKP